MGCGQRSEDRLQDFFALGVQPQPVLRDPVIVKGLGQADPGFEVVLAALELPLVAVGGDQRVPQPADLLGSVVGGDLDEPGPDRLDGFLAEPGPQLVHLHQGHRGVTDPDPAREHGRGQSSVADRPGGVGHGDQLGGAPGPERGSPPDHPGCGAGRVRGGDHAPAQGLGQ